MDVEKAQELYAGLEEGIKVLVDENPVSAAVVGINDKGETLTGYFHADAQAKTIFAHNINADAMLDVVLNNIEMARDALDELDNVEQEDDRS